ncbi:MAG: sigma-54 dependent transcriptional regulator, partial [Vicinamibacteria bacterium]|nr:sigma-54 dependent transcriptional regulator [Vicinamibacteria bacterium]
DVLAAGREVDPELPIIVMTAFGTVEDAVRAMKEGASDFLLKPVDTDHLMLLLERTLERRRMLTELILLKEEYQRRFGLPKAIGEDPALKESMLAVQRAAMTDTTVLILGESGTGKELAARSLHQLSPRVKGPFVAINCAAIPETLLENELFGHEKGAFTGAGSRKTGKVEMAHRGTLFLDEIADMPLSLQGKILRLVQEHQFERVGGLQTITVDVRLVAATNRDLRAAVVEKAFREDLFFRLSVLPIEIPPLRRRRGDILILAEAFLERFAREMGRRLPVLPDATRRALVEHSWPGNVRELQNCMERALILCDSETLLPEHLRIEAPTRSVSLMDVMDCTGPLDDVIERARGLAEGEAIRLALLRAQGDKVRAAQSLGLSSLSLVRRMKSLGIEAHAERAEGEARA